MNSSELKRYALLVEDSIRSEFGSDKDVNFLSEYEPLLIAIEDAKNEVVRNPRELTGLSRWLLDSNIRSHPVLSDRLSGFLLLLRGWKLPNE